MVLLSVWQDGQTKDLSISSTFWMALMGVDFRMTATDQGDGHLKTTCGPLDTGIDNKD